MARSPTHLAINLKRRTETQPVLNWILAFLPDQAMVLLIIGIGFALMFRIINLRGAISLLAGLVIVILLSPFVEAVVESLPWWITILLLLIIGLSLLRAVSGTLIGSRATDEMVGSLGADVVRGALRFLFWLLAAPFRVFIWALRRHY